VRSVKGSWLVFILLGAGMWFLRYGDILSREHLGMLKDYGPYLLLVIHVILVLMAFQDAVFQGILCLFIPLYSFYWLFIVTDAFLLRAIVAALCVGIGQDSVMFYQDVLNDVFRTVTDWIKSGGGEVRY